MLGETTIALIITAAAASVGTLTIEHGWGWILGKIRARRARLQSQLANLTDDAKAVIGDLTGRVAKIEADVTALKTKTGL